MTATNPGTCQYATFYAGGHYLGIGVLEVQEVLREQPITPVPLSAPVVAGLINLRGQIVPQLDVRRLLGLPVREPGAITFSVVVRTEHGAVSLLVDQIDDVLDLDASSFEQTPANVVPAIRKLLLGVHKLEGRLLLILNIPETVDVRAD
jgi:purine-binding chemotaxis protein CheW